MATRYGIYRRLSSPSIVVRIDQAAIERSIRRDSGHCMISTALRQQLPGITGVAVDVATIRWTDPTKRFRFVYLTPRVAQLALIDYDRGINPQPFAFKLHRAVQIARRQRTKATTEPTKPQRRTRRRDAHFAPLGAPRIQGEGHGAQPPVVGGKAPPPANLSKTRRFGARLMRE
jgi:hypothetical protein